MFKTVARAIRQEVTKEALTVKEEVQLHSFIDNAILYIRDPKISIRKFLKMNIFSKV